MGQSTSQLYHIRGGGGGSETEEKNEGEDWQASGSIKSLCLQHLGVRGVKVEVNRGEE